MTVEFISFVSLIARRGALWLVRKQAEKDRRTRDMFAIICAALLMAALLTERIASAGSLAPSSLVR